MTRRSWVILALLVLFLGSATWFVFRRTDNATVVRADFAYVNGIYPGSNVTILGVPVGKVTEVVPQGTSVRVSMSVPGDVALPADLQAYIVSPALISDRSVDLGPAYSGSGPTFTDGQVIPIDKTHAPITFDSMLGSLSTLSAALSPDQGDLAALLSRGADQWHGQGRQFNTAIRNLSTATAVVGARGDDIGAIVTNLSTMMSAFDRRQLTLNQFVEQLGQLGDSWASQRIDVTATVNDLKTVLDQLSQVVDKHGAELGDISGNLNAVGDLLVRHQPDLAEFMDLVPLMMQNMKETVGPDRRGRIRLNVSSVLTQFAAAHDFCERTRWPICSGMGLTNPVSYPISRSDPLGIVTAVTGATPPPNPRYPR
ncbi:MAG: MCE family protein [Mycobacterium sp.]|nr:MCE family protein [Mycobacterium sp.]